MEVGNEPGAWMASELNVADVSKVSEFYNQVFDGQVSPWEGADGYCTIMVGDFVAGIMRDMPAVLGNDAQAQWINYFACSNLEQTAAQIESMGGSKVGEIEQIPIARKALFRDPQGAVFGLFEMAE